jgi:hypothetical protein
MLGACAGVSSGILCRFDFPGFFTYGAQKVGPPRRWGVNGLRSEQLSVTSTIKHERLYPWGHVKAG